RLSSAVTIRVGAQFNPLTCNSTSAILGSAGPVTFYRDFTGAALPSTWYAVALANAMHGSDLDASDDISAQFSSTIGTPGCLTSSGWYYGLDGNPPSNLIDFYTVLLHELGHGLGFLTIVDLTTGAKALGFNDAYMRFLENHGASPPDYPSMTNAQRVTASTATGNLHWTGTNVRAASGVLTAGNVGDHVRMYAPNPAVSGSSVSHWDTALTPNQLMEPNYTGPLHTPVLELPLFQDIGWTLLSPPPPAAALQVTPIADVAASGPAGGPFTPNSFQYQLISSTGSVNFSISGIPSWLTASFTSGTATTTPITVTFSVSGSANALGVGTYGPTTISFTNTTNGQGSTTRNATLNVTTPALVVSPASDIAVSGPQGGPFGPSSFQYQLSATAGSLNYSITGIPSWLSASSTSGTVATGGTTVTFTVNTSTNNLASALYTGIINFTNTTTGSGNTSRKATLTVNPRACEASAKLPEFNFDGKSDVVFQNDSGAVGVWQLNGGAIASAATVGNAPAGWRLVGTGNLNGDGASDLLWRHSSGTVGVWFMNGSSLVSAANIATVGNDWHVVGVGDLDGDGKADILWRHDSGVVGYWLMNGTTILSAGNIGTVDNQWRLVGIGDLNGDGKIDFVWLHDSGTVGVWLMNGPSITTATNVGTAPPGWHIVGIGNLDGDGASDLLWRHDSGAVGVWFMNGASIASAATIATIGNDWHVVAAGDINGDGKADILWRHDSGTVGYWLMNGTAVLSAGNLSAPGNDWHIVGGEHDHPVAPLGPGPC
ncbi:MAG: hypothetical protein QOF19_2845, partial [Alphaproteobacteria bacterium]|nr:hypothetical protein [Alphaproteobacteria bacterium]